VRARSRQISEPKPANQFIHDLVKALDSFPGPVRVLGRPFLMAMEGVHTVEGRGTFATGKPVASGGCEPPV
jgi:translation elongation factor EF-Tu-like GTPase